MASPRPIEWVVRDILLIESLVGKTTHIEHGRWALTPPGD